jgi:diguanylate cyclase (GGDEF)-like protein
MKLSLHLRLSLVITLFSLVAVFVVSIIFYKVTYQREQKASLEAVSELAQTVYHSATIAAYANNNVIAEDILKGLMSNHLVEEAHIHTNGITVAQGQITPQSIPPIVRQLYSPFDDKEQLGELSITPKKEIIDEQARIAAVSLVEQITVLLFLSTAFITFLIWLVIGRPVTTLAHHLAKIDPANNTIRLQTPAIVKNSELDLFAFTVNELLDRVQEQIIEERHLRNSVELIAKNFQMIFDLSSNALIVTDPSLNILTFNPAFQDLIYSATGSRRPPQDSSWITLMVKNPDEFILNINALLRDKSNSSVDIKLLSEEDNRRRWVSISAREALNTFNEKIILIFFNDITRQHEALNESEQAANTDHLTHLQNRRIAERNITQMIHDAFISQKSMALLVIDLDGFKAINDIHGHEAGDKVLIEVAKRLQTITRRTDVVSRWGGDEFVLALHGAEQRESLQLANKMLAAISAPIDINEEIAVQVGASIGITLCPASAINFMTAFECADIAMYQVKKSGKHGIKIYTNPLEIQS